MAKVPPSYDQILKVLVTFLDDVAIQIELLRKLIIKKVDRSLIMIFESAHVWVLYWDNTTKQYDSARFPFLIKYLAICETKLLGNLVSVH